MFWISPTTIHWPGVPFEKISSVNPEKYDRVPLHRDILSVYLGNVFPWRHRPPFSFFVLLPFILALLHIVCHPSLRLFWRWRRSFQNQCAPFCQKHLILPLEFSSSPHFPYYERNSPHCSHSSFCKFAYALPNLFSGNPDHSNTLFCIGNIAEVPLPLVDRHCTSSQ